jgi:RimJ/RimL family protein N-acetyltransferase
MKTSNIFNTLRPWINQKLGVSVDLADSDPVPVYGTDARNTGPPLWAAKRGEQAIVTARGEWVEPLKPVVAELVPDELFSVFGAYQLSRVLLPNGFGVWGPSWFYVGDENSFHPTQDDRTVHLEPDEMAEIVDRRVFWHCFEDDAIAGFGIFDDQRRLIALAAVHAGEDALWEIGMDVAPEAKGRGLGRAVVSAAGAWILEQNRLILATTAPWNVPSARTLRAVGLQFIMSAMVSMPAPFRVPPQPLGSPAPGVEIYNYYPDWAMNGEIQSSL